MRWIARFLGVAVVCGVLVFASTHPSEGANHTEWYTVKRYDALWTIAATHYGGDPRAAIEQIVQRNKLHTDVIVPGQTLLLP